MWFFWLSYLRSHFFITHRSPLHFLKTFPKNVIPKPDVFIFLQLMIPSFQSIKLRLEKTSSCTLPEVICSYYKLFLFFSSIIELSRSIYFCLWRVGLKIILQQENGREKCVCLMEVWKKHVWHSWWLRIKTRRAGMYSF